MTEETFLNLGIFLFALALGYAAWWIMRRKWRLPVGDRGTGESRGWMLDLSRQTGFLIHAMAPTFMRAMKKRDREQLQKAGLYPKWDSEELVGMQFFCALYSAAFIGWYVFGGSLFWSLIALLLGAWLPRWYVKKQREERQLELLRSFPTAIDMIVLGLEGGLDITSGVEEMIRNSEDNPLRREFQRLHHDIASGEPRAAAFRSLAQRVDAMEIRATILSMVQAMEMGSEIGPLMRVQAEQLRFNRLMRAEEAANKTPTKMMLPMAFFILPCMFLVIFAPIVIGVIQSFRGL